MDSITILFPFLALALSLIEIVNANPFLSTCPFATDHTFSISVDVNAANIARCASDMFLTMGFFLAEAVELKVGEAPTLAETIFRFDLCNGGTTRRRDRRGLQLLGYNYFGGGGKCIRLYLVLNPYSIPVLD
jgi:hypothetical protein